MSGWFCLSLFEYFSVDMFNNQRGIALIKPLITSKKNKMFVLAIDAKKGCSATPTIWIKETETGIGYYWPLFGLHFKLKNYVPLPIDLQVLKTEWRWVPCKILLNGSKYSLSIM